MSDFEKFVRLQGFNSDFERGSNGRYKSDLLHFMEKAFMHQQAKIDELQKQVEAVSQVLCELKESLKDFQEVDLYDKGYRVTTEYVIADLEKALRGEHERN